MQNKKEKWINEIEESLENIQHVSHLSSSFKSELINNLSTVKRIVGFSKTTVWAMAASFVLLIAVNVFATLQNDVSIYSESGDAYSEFIDSYELLPNTIITEYQS